MISLACPRCRHALQVTDEFAGRQGTCPKCRHLFAVPSPGSQTTATGMISSAPETQENAFAQFHGERPDRKRGQEKGMLDPNLSFAAVAIGAFSLLLAFLPYVCLLAGPIAVLGSILAVYGIIHTWGKSGTSAPLVGYIVGLAFDGLAGFVWLCIVAVMWWDGQL